MAGGDAVEVGELGDLPARDPLPTEPLSTGCRVGGVECGVPVALVDEGLLLLDRLTRSILGGTLGVAEGERRALALTLLGLARGLETAAETEPDPEPEAETELEPGDMTRVLDTFDLTSL